MFSTRASWYFLTSLLCLLFLINSCGDDPPTKPPDQPSPTWSLDLAGDGDDALSAIAPLSDGNYIALGFTNSTGSAGEDFYAIKFTADGDTLWTHRYGGAGGDIGTTVVGTHDGGAVLGGLSNSFGSNGLDIWIVKVDSQGDTLWNHSFGSTGLDRVHDMILTADNSIVAVGTIAIGSETRAWAAKISSDGKLVWDRQYYGDGDGELTTIEELPSGELFVAGHRGSAAPIASWLTIDSDGDSVTAGWYIFQGGYHVGAMTRGTNNRYTLAGWHKPTSVNAHPDFFAMQINELNNMQWERKYGGAEDDECHEIFALPDGNLMLVGNTRSFDGLDWDLYTIRIDTNGVVVDEMVYKDDVEAEMVDICPTPDGRYIIVGSQTPSGMPSDIMLRKLEL